MICEYCGGATCKMKVKGQHWLYGLLFIGENVDTEECGECGERYYHATTIDQIDRMLMTEHEVKECLSVEVVGL